MELVSLIYELTDSFPKHELYGLTQQIRRADVLADGSKLVLERSAEVGRVVNGLMASLRRKLATEI